MKYRSFRINGFIHGLLSLEITADISFVPVERIVYDINIESTSHTEKCESLGLLSQSNNLGECVL